MDFFNIVKLLLDDSNKMVHKHLEVPGGVSIHDAFLQAALFNAGMAQVEEIMAIPDRMIEDSKEVE